MKQFKEDKMGGACSAYGQEHKLIENFDGNTRRKETTWKIFYI